MSLVPEMSLSSPLSDEIVSLACLCDPSLRITRNRASLEKKHILNIHQDAVLVVYPVSRRYPVFELYSL